MTARTALGPGVEFDLIRRFLAESAAATLPDVVRVGPGDDCVVIGDLAITTDMAVENIHFRRDWMTAEQIGYRAAAAALSDLAAMAAEPIGVLVSIALATEDADTFAPEVMRGVVEAARASGGALLGGDVSRTTGGLVLDVVAIGRVEKPVLRSGARSGDELWVTGPLGGAAAAVAAWRRGSTPADDARETFLRPAPRWREARWLAERGVLHALIDISDGIAGDAGHIAAASGVEVVLDAPAVPVHAAARARPDALALALHGGEDYELLFAAPAGSVQPHVSEFAGRFGTTPVRVGAARTGRPAVLVRDAQGEEREPGRGGHDHFRVDAT